MAVRVGRHGATGEHLYDWSFVRLNDDNPPHGNQQAGRRWLLVRRTRDTGELAFYHCWTPRSTLLTVLVKVAGRRWRSASRPAGPV